MLGAIVVGRLYLLMLPPLKLFCFPVKIVMMPFKMIPITLLILVLLALRADSACAGIEEEKEATIVFTKDPKKISPDVKFLKALKNTPRHPAPVQKAPVIYDDYIHQASQKHHLDPNLVKAVIKQESNFNRSDVSWKGAQGLMQLMPDTARRLGVYNSFDPYENIHGGTRYLQLMLLNFNGNLAKALAAYNAGPEAVRKYGRIPPYRETQDYVRKVLHYYKIYRGSRLMAFEDRDGKLVFTDIPAVSEASER